MPTDTLTPLANHLLISIPERFNAPKGPRSPDGLAIHLLTGEDAMHELEAQIKRGGKIQIETDTDRSIRNLVRVGQVLQIPPTLNDQMYLCAAGEGYRTFADITPVVEVGDTVYLDYSCLTDENEILPGIYRVPYAAVICTIWDSPAMSWDSPELGKGSWEASKLLIPVGGYVLLSRVWADDVQDYEIDGRMRKVRFGKDGYLIDQVDVPPLDNEGVIAWLDAPLKGAGNELRTGQRVLITKGQALTETICGEELLCIRQDYVLAIREHESVGMLRDYLRNTPAEELQADWDAVSNGQPIVDGAEVHNITYAHSTPHTLTISAEEAGDGEWLKRAGYHLPTSTEVQNPFSDEVIDASVAKTVEAIRQNSFTQEFQRLPLKSGLYNV